MIGFWDAWHQLGHMQVCTSLQTDNLANIPPLSFLQAGCPFCRPTNSVKALTESRVLILVFVSVREHISETTCPFSTSCSMHVTHGCGSLLLYQRSDM